MQRLMNDSVSCMWREDKGSWECRVLTTEYDQENQRYYTRSVMIDDIKECDEKVAPYALMIAHGIRPSDEYNYEWFQEHTELLDQSDFQ